jgi:hypothetical protein
MLVIQKKFIEPEVASPEVVNRTGNEREIISHAFPPYFPRFFPQELL